ncbi:MAG TPA: PfkB family carbohydrate kinase [Patescibacteria group bacterium]|nr:PfkB family carbohydrate kinase [Patescibacteria group bacterium]
MPEYLIKLIEEFQKKKIMVIGDMVADVYLEGRISRISREAPVLVLEQARETVVPGGAANAVHNAATLGGTTYAVGVLGDDSAGRELTRVLAENSVNTVGLIVEPDRPTITKTRILAGGQATVRQQVVRIDRQSDAPLSAAGEAAILRFVAEHIPQMSFVVVSDYGGGTMTEALLRRILDLCRQAGVRSMVDSRYNILAYRGVTIVKQNESEAAAALEIKNMNESNLLLAGKSLLERLDAEVVLITRGPEGMSLFDKPGNVIHIPVTNVSEVYDVTGAGDTVVVTMALALAAGASYETAARLANFAAGVVVRKPGTATTTPSELITAIGDYHENC